MATATQARRALGERLRDIRKDAGLTGKDLADKCRWHFTKVSKIEHGTQNPSEDDLRAWCLHCAADDQLADLIASVRTIDSMYTEWRRALRSGVKHGQEAEIPLYERTRLFRVYEPALIPGLLQTPDYATAVIRSVVAFHGAPDDVADAVAARMFRQRVLHFGDHRFLFVIEEQALRTRVGAADVMVSQLERLLTVMTSQRVSLGIVPAMAERQTWPSVGFWLFDDARVHAGTPSADLTITQRSEITVFARKFDQHQQAAAYGDQAREIVRRAIAAHRAT